MGEGVRMRMCVGRGGDNEHVCWERGWERV